MFQTKSSLLAALAMSAISASTAAMPRAATSVSNGRNPAAWTTHTKRKPWGGSVKRHARAAAKARRTR